MQEILQVAMQRVCHLRECLTRGWKLFLDRDLQDSGSDLEGSVRQALPLLFANSVHDVSNDGLHLVRR
jgi:hypothetical protein